MNMLNATGLTKGATCFLKAVEALDKVSTVKIVGQPQYGRPVAGDAEFKKAVQALEAAARAFQAAGVAYSEGRFEEADRCERRARRRFGSGESHYRKGYKLSCGG
ncbi:MAG: hypothetical protein K2Y32_23085 [Candidatus Obscuribacterales bacterium]|nr:hypothetical protein [Candidatus Obscuribacterales bacterium]